MERALYDPVDGFYSAGGSAGRRGDFITSPEVGPLFGAIVARTLDATWHELGEPDTFVVAEAAAGVGTLARSVLAATPDCAGALSYVLVETSAGMRSVHGDLVDRGCESRSDLPDAADVILANELLDNLPARILERSADGWTEVAIDEHFTEVLVPADTDPAGGAFAVLAELGDKIDIGARIPVVEQARAWIDAALGATRHRLIVFDYGADSPELAARGQASWLRAYRSHQRVDQPFAQPGSADITIDVPFDQLQRPSSMTTQADWLVGNGLETMLDEARVVWQERAKIGDLAAIRARSALGEADALTDADGLGGFIAAEWRK